MNHWYTSALIAFARLRNSNQILNRTGPPDSPPAYRRRRRSLLRSCEGGALVEVAVTLPIVMVIMTGIFSFSIALYQKLQLAEAVSVGGRQLAVARGQTDACTMVTNAIYAAAPGLTSNSITLTYVLNGTSPTNGTSNGAGVSSCSTTDLAAGTYAQVKATYPCSLSVYGMSYTSCSLGTQITEVVQ